jgi:hypothetical protein
MHDHCDYVIHPRLCDYCHKNNAAPNPMNIDICNECQDEMERALHTAINSPEEPNQQEQR